MSEETVQKGPDLVRLAARLRHRHETLACTCPCTCAPDVEAADRAAMLDLLPDPPSMDARERKWAAEKLLRPIDPEDDEDDLSPEDNLEMCCRLWENLTAETPVAAPLSPERVRLLAKQFRETVGFARRAWGMHYAPDGQPPDDGDADGDQ